MPCYNVPKNLRHGNFLSEMAAIAASRLLLYPKRVITFLLNKSERDHFGLYIHVFEDKKHNGIKNPILLITLQVKSKYVKHILFPTFEYDATSPAGKNGMTR